MFEIQNGFSQSRGLKLYWDTLRQLGRKIKIFAAKGPVYHYTYGYWRLRRRLKLKWVETAGLDEQALLTQFNLEIAELHQIKQALSEGNVDQAKAEVLGHFQTRNSPRFFFEPEQIKQITALVNEAQKEATLRTADQICQNIFCFRRTSPVHFDQGIDWSHRPAGNIDWMWDLNRHAYFETLGRAYHYTGDERYAQKIRQLWLHWLANNPGRVGQPNWASAFEVGFRINTWIWTFYYLRLTTAFDADTCLAVLKGLLTHGHYLEANLELHVQNNHLLLEAKALAMLGLLFPEFKAAEKWRQRGLKVLYQQIRAQVCPDGVHGERATHYHRVIAGELLELLVLLENNGSPIPPDVN
ncbi:MAG TPA: heparinase II/III family protein, partial [Anaerolineae bacterium]|nr:heparinase II/III family protein [Anaerolineae bacterium]